MAQRAKRSTGQAGTSSGCSGKCPIAPIYRVIAFTTADNDVTIGTADNGIVTGIAEDRVICAASPDGIITGTTVNGHSGAIVSELLTGQVDDVITESGADLVDLADLCPVTESGEFIVEEKSIAVGIASWQIPS